MVVAITSLRPAVRCCSRIGPAKGWIIPVRTSAAASAAAWTAAWERPLAMLAACRASIMLGRFSPTRLNRPYRIFSPGMVRLMRPADRMASVNTMPLPPDSRVRSRSKNAAAGAFMAADGSRRKAGKAPLGERRLSTGEPEGLGGAR